MDFRRKLHREPALAREPFERRARRFPAVAGDGLQ
jgi:hypothetical protein